jgi:BMFP domain-containing protein YqiC
MSKNSDFLSTLKSIANNVQLGNKSATDVADSVNAWIKESSEALKVKIEDEVERSVSKMGFVKRGEFEALKQEVASLKNGGKRTTSATRGAKKAPAKKSAVSKSATKKSVKKVAKKSTAKKDAK